MYCKNCGKEVDKNAYVCLNCGALIKEEPISQSKDDKGNNVEELKNTKNILLTIAFCLSCFSLFFELHPNFGYLYIDIDNFYDLVIFALFSSIVSIAILFIVFIIKIKIKKEKYYDIICSFAFSLSILLPLFCYIY